MQAARAIFMACGGRETYFENRIVQMTELKYAAFEDINMSRRVCPPFSLCETFPLVVRY